MVGGVACLTGLRGQVENVMCGVVFGGGVAG